MRKYTKAQVVGILRGLVSETSGAKVGAELQVSSQLISMVLLGQRVISDELAIKVLQLNFHQEFVKVPDAYVRAPKQK
jgi:hypothetical protein